MLPLIIFLGILSLGAVTYGILKWRILYVGNQNLAQRLSKEGLNLEKDKLHVDGTTMTISEYRLVSGNSKRIFTTLEYRYRAPFLRSFHVARRPSEEMAVKLNSDVMEEIPSGNPDFDAIYIMRSSTGQEVLEFLDDSFFTAMAQALHKHEANVEVFDSFFRWYVPGPPAFLDAKFLSRHARAAARLAKILETCRQKKPLPEPQATIYRIFSSQFATGDLELSPDGGAQFTIKNQEVPIYCLLRHTDDGFHLRAPVFDDEPEYRIAISPTASPADYRSREYHVRVLGTSTNYSLLVIFSKKNSDSKDSIKSIIMENHKRRASAYGRRFMDTGIVNTVEANQRKLEELVRRWSPKRYPALEVNTRFVRAYVPGPISEAAPLNEVINILTETRHAFLKAHETSSKDLY